MTCAFKAVRRLLPGENLANGRGRPFLEFGHFPQTAERSLEFGHFQAVFGDLTGEDARPCSLDIGKTEIALRRLQRPAGHGPAEADSCACLRQTVATSSYG